MNHPEDLDNFVKNKLNSRSFDYKEDYWNEVAAKLHKRKRLKIIRNIFYSGLSAACLAILFWGVHFQFSDNNIFLEKIATSISLENKKNILEKTKTIVLKDSEEMKKFADNETVEYSGVQNFSTENNTQQSHSESVDGSNYQTAADEFVYNETNSTTDNYNQDVLNNNENIDSSTTNQNFNSLVDASGNSNSESSNFASNSFIQNIIANTIIENNISETPKLSTLLCENRFQKKLSIYGLAGVAVLKPFQGNVNEGNTISTGVVFGLKLQYMFSPNWSVGCGINYHTRNKLNTDTTVTVINYDFGYTLFQKTVRANFIQYAEFPLFATYHLSKNHSFSSGIIFAFNTAVNQSVTEITTNNFETETIDKNEMKAFEGFENFDYRFAVAYNYSYGKSAFGLEAHYGLQDVTSNSFFNNSTADKNMQLRFYAAYQLF